MNDPNYRAQNSSSSKGLTIRFRPRHDGPRTIYMTENVKYEVPDYGYPDDDEDTLPDLTKYPVGPSGRPIAGSKRVARYRERGSLLSSGEMLQSITAQPAFANNSFEVCLNYGNGFVHPNLRLYGR
jgi:hypothetical protein